MLILKDVVCQRTPAGTVWLRLGIYRDGADSYKSYTIAQAEDLDKALEDAQIADYEMIELIQKKVFSALKGGPLGIRNFHAAGLVSSVLSVCALMIATSMAFKPENTNATTAPVAPGCPLPAVQETLAQIEGINLRTEAMRAAIAAPRNGAPPTPIEDVAASIKAEEPRYEFTWN